MQLRKFDDETENAMLDVNSFWKLERDPLYKWGKQKGALEIAREMKKDKFPIETIAKLTKLPVKEIEAL